jgi:hypothetical protein
LRRSRVLLVVPGGGKREDEGMAVQLAAEEPEAGPWRVETLSAVVAGLTQRGTRSPATGRPFILAVDGRSSSGKTMLTARMRQQVPRSAVVHTDDIAWGHSRFGWADLLIDGILRPVHRGAAVTFHPPGSAAHGRQGAITVPGGCPLLLIEGAGAGRREAACLVDALVWVQSDERGTRQRSLRRVGAPGGPPTIQERSDQHRPLKS